jgi:hypothetical protein
VGRIDGKTDFVGKPKAHGQDGSLRFTPYKGAARRGFAIGFRERRREDVNSGACRGHMNHNAGERPEMICRARTLIIRKLVGRV